MEEAELGDEDKRKTESVESQDEGESGLDNACSLLLDTGKITYEEIVYY